MLLHFGDHAHRAPGATCLLPRGSQCLRGCLRLPPPCRGWGQEQLPGLNQPLGFSGCIPQCQATIGFLMGHCFFHSLKLVFPALFGVFQFSGAICSGSSFRSSPPPLFPLGTTRATSPLPVSLAPRWPSLPPPSPPGLHRQAFILNLFCFLLKSVRCLQLSIPFMLWPLPICRPVFFNVFVITAVLRSPFRLFFLIPPPPVEF